MAFDPERLETFRARIGALVESGHVPGLVALVAANDGSAMESIGVLGLEKSEPMSPTTIFRIASITKPMAAATAMALIARGTFSLSDPVERFLPELANRRVLRTLASEPDDTVPANRSITIEDLLTCRLGFGSIMAPPDTYPIQEAEAALGLKTLSWPWPANPIDSDEWIRRFSTLPLLEQPGERWRYHTGIQILGILIERATNSSLEQAMRDCVFDPVGMPDTTFTLPAGDGSRLATAYLPDHTTGELVVFDSAESSEWAAPPAMANAAAGLLSTLNDVWAFAQMLRNEGMADGRRVLSRESVAAMTRNHLTAAQRADAAQFLGPDGGWGYGMAAPVAGTSDPSLLAGYGWDGGTGCSWRTDPITGLTGILLTQRGVNSPEPQHHFLEFWEGARALVS